MSLGLQRSHQDSAELLTPSEEGQEGSDLSLRAQSPVCSCSILHHPGHWKDKTNICILGKIPPFPSDKHIAMTLKSRFGMLSISNADSGLESTFLKSPTY